MLHDTIGFLLAAATRLSKREFDKIFQKKYQITAPQWAVLRFLCEEGGMPQTQISERLYWEKATVGDIVEKLQAKGLVERTVSAADRRAYCVSATAQGKALIEPLTEDALLLDSKTCSVLSPEEQEVLHGLLEKIIDHLNTDF